MGRIQRTYHRRLFLILSLMGHIRRTCPRILKGRIQFNIRRRSSRLLFFLLGRIRFFKLFRIPSQPFRMAYTLFCFLLFVGVSCFGLKLWWQVMHLKVVQLCNWLFKNYGLLPNLRLSNVLYWLLPLWLRLSNVLYWFYHGYYHYTPDGYYH